MVARPLIEKCSSTSLGIVRRPAESRMTSSSKAMSGSLSSSVSPSNTIWRRVSLASMPSRMATTRLTWRAISGSWLTIMVVRLNSWLRWAIVS